MKKITTTIALLLILSFVLVSLPQITIVKAQSIIYIHSDGSFDGTDKIVREGNVYTFTGDINGSVVVERDNIVVDGAGFVLQGTTLLQETGDWDFVSVNISSRKNVTVKNITIKHAGYDTMRIFDSSNCSILNTIIIITQGYFSPRIHLNNSSNNVLSGNDGQITLVNSDGNILLDNPWSIRLSKSSNNTITGNGNIELTEASNNFISKNNSSIKLYTMSNGNIISENNGFIGLWDSSNNSIIGNNGAILIFESHNNPLIQNTIEDNSPYGIELSYSSDNIVSENIIQNNKLDICYVFNTTFYQNDFVNASIDIVDDSNIFWDNGNEGNYWNDYSGLDENEDGIGDTPYIIDENNQDNYPLMAPNIIPEFPSWLILPLLMIALLFVIIFKKKVFRSIQY